MDQAQFDIIGNVVDEDGIKLTYTADGTAIAKFRIGARASYTDRDGNRKDRKRSYTTVTAFGQYAENLAETNVKGIKLRVTGRMETHEWTTDQNEPRSRTDFIVEHAGPVLAFATAKVTDNPKRS